MKTITGNFKVGDKIRALKSSGCGGYIKGNIYEVKGSQKKRFSTDKFWIDTVLDSNGSKDNAWFNDCFELVGPRYKRNLPDWW